MTALREAPFAFHDLLRATTTNVVRYLLSAGDVRVVCGVCEATFPQTDDGHRALRDHELAHGLAHCVNASELDGKILRIVTWGVKRHYSDEMSVEMWGIDDELGVAYHLSNAYQHDMVWKWRITKEQSGALACLNAATPPGQD